MAVTAVAMRVCSCRSKPHSAASSRVRWRTTSTSSSPRTSMRKSAWIIGSRRLRHHHGGVVAPAGEVTIDDACDQRRVAMNERGQARPLPLRPHAVGGEQQDVAGGERHALLLLLAQLAAADDPVAGGDPLGGAVAMHQLRVDVADAYQHELAALALERRDDAGGAPGGPEG